MLSKTSAGALSARLLVVGAILLALSAGMACAAGRITDVGVSNKTDRVTISVQGDCALKMTPILSKQGTFVGFQFPGSLATRGRLVPVRSGGVHNVRYSNFSSRPSKVRIVVNTTTRLDYCTEWSPDRTRVKISVLKLGQRQAAKPKTSWTLVPSTEPTKPVALNEEKKPAPATRKSVQPAEAKAPRTIDSSAYAAIAAKSRTRLTPTLVASAAPAAVASGPAASRVNAPEPTVRVLGVVETTPQPSAPAEPVRVATTGQPRVHVIAQPGGSPRVAVSIPVENRQLNGPRVSLNFLGADINDVLKAISVQSGHNVVAGKDVTGNVTLSLSNVSVDEAMDYVARLSGYSYTNENGTYLVAQKANLGLISSGDEHTELEMVGLSYASAEDIKSLLNARIPELQVTLFAQKGQTSKATTQVVKDASLFSETRWMRDVPPSSDMLALSGSRSMIEEAKAIIAQTEDAIRKHKETARNWLEEKKHESYTAKYANPSELSEAIMALVPGVWVAFAPSNDFELVKFKSAEGDGDAAEVKREFDSTGSASKPEEGKSGGGQGQGQANATGDQLTSETKSRTLVILGSDDAVAKALQAAAQLDVKAPQVKIDAKITSINKSGEKKLGLTWSWDGLSFMEGFTDFEKTTGTSDDDGNTQNVQKSHGGWYRQPWNVSAALDALVTNGDAQVLASPSIMCLNRNPGVFFVGDEVTYIQRIETTATGQNIVTDTKKVGVQMLAVAEANADGYITLYLHPEVSTLELTVEQGVTLPVVSSRFTDHVVRVKDGQTLVIGGLIRNDEIEGMSKVPFLGDLPFLGHLFRHSTKSTDHTEVVMFITASIIKD